MTRPRTFNVTLSLLLLAAVPAPADSIAIPRRSKATEEELRKDLEKVKDVGLDQADAARLFAMVEDGSKKKVDIKPDIGITFYGQNVSRLGKAGLPWKSFTDATLGRDDAESMNVLSTELRDALTKSATRTDPRPDAGKVRSHLFGKNKNAAEWKTARALPPLMQLMQAESEPVRSLLIEFLADIDGKEATAAIAQRAIFDLSSAIREKAVAALAKRTDRDYWPVLADGLRYPWAPAADHAAEAIAALRVESRLSDLVDLLKEPDPNITFTEGKRTMVREVVRLNHMSNCLVCHAPSQSTSQLLRGRVPSPGEAPPPLYYRDTKGVFVRADVSYLRQDFSVVQPVLKAGKWPGHQRYDYFVLKRPATFAESEKGLKSGFTPRTDLPDESKLTSNVATYPQRDAVLFALKEITKADAGKSYDQWAKYLKDRKR